MKLSPHEIRAAYFAVERVRLSGGFVPPSVAALSGRLAMVMSIGEAVTQSRHDSSEVRFAETPLKGANELCRSRLAADICGRSVRWVHRNAQALGGIKVDGLGFVFDVEAVRRYAKHLEVNDEQP